LPAGSAVSASAVVIESPSSSRTPVRTATSPYVDVAGTWRGVGYQYDTKGHWNIEMTLYKRGSIGDVIGTVIYEDGGCVANLIREAERGDLLVMRERLTTGQGRCVDDGWIRIPRRSTGNELEWRWDFDDQREGASSTLKRDN
jgi:hypothetical protein